MLAICNDGVDIGKTRVPLQDKLSIRQDMLAHSLVCASDNLGDHVRVVDNLFDVSNVT